MSRFLYLFTCFRSRWTHQSRYMFQKSESVVSPVIYHILCYVLFSIFLCFARGPCNEKQKGYYDVLLMLPQLDSVDNWMHIWYSYTNYVLWSSCFLWKSSAVNQMNTWGWLHWIFWSQHFYHWTILAVLHKMHSSSWTKWLNNYHIKSLWAYGGHQDHANFPLPILLVRLMSLLGLWPSRILINVSASTKLWERLPQKKRKPKLRETKGRRPRLISWVRRPSLQLLTASHKSRPRRTTPSRRIATRSTYLVAS